MAQGEGAGDGDGPQAGVTMLLALADELALTDTGTSEALGGDMTEETAGDDNGVGPAVSVGESGGLGELLPDPADRGVAAHATARRAVIPIAHIGHLMQQQTP